ncbi:MAG: FkbM family methyltransferase [Roseofilum sp. SBFL]|uniref:FkbM family methyltransferase n=1 Tax=unclassified Roseofilum TaxID=2620099 RepID=UPI001B281F5E|nr:MULTISPECIES: FkbM family methyltransferase [unclassified Roseofilum]MBP0012722.1 FkbM family methyltransferase [Roseofilum sp. SID3]MBP0023826.1 FkbM family methyltransferase [Roseofilum sp. SID2]MBP0036116.1 FkbM family methyltransferase [Roseofilum sp. SID1]MBP0040484.1 FkbM family methyltransferase [Roseofilum sp. SBFL]
MMNINYEWISMRIGLLKHPQFYRNPIMAFWRRLVWKLYAERQPLLRFETEYGFEIEAQPQDISVGSLFYRGQYEWAELKWWKKLLDRDNMVILDVGANMGLYSLLSAAYSRQNQWSGVRIFGFEPNPIEYSKLKRNIEINGYSEISVFPLAISDNKNIASLVIPPIGQGMFSHLINKKLPDENSGNIVEVQTKDLDTWCSHNAIESIHLLKIDVEGHELSVLKGAENFLSNQLIHNIFMEVGHGQWREAVSALNHFGYSINLINKQGQLEPFDEDRVEGWSNILAQLSH